MSHDSAPREYICGESRPSVATLLNNKSWPRTSESTWERPGQRGEPSAHVVYVTDTRRLYGALRGSVLHMAPFSAISVNSSFAGSAGPICGYGRFLPY